MSPETPLPEIPGFSDLRSVRRRGALELFRATAGGRPVALRCAWPGATPAEESELEAELAVLALARPAGSELVEHGTLADGTRYLARRWVAGQTLAEWAVGREPREIGAVLAATADALEQLHGRGFCHGDLKPDNLLVDEAGRVTPIDFGLAGELDRDRGGGGGTAGFVAPEVLFGAAPSPSADLFALGALAHLLLGGTLASGSVFYARFPRSDFFESHGSSLAELPEWARDLVQALVEREPQHRPPGAGHVAQLVRQRLGSSPPAQLPPPRLELPVMLGRRDFLEGLCRDLGEGAAPGLALRLPPGEPADGVREGLALALALRGQRLVRVDLEARAAELQDGLALDAWALDLVREASGAVLLCDLGATEAWTERAATVLVRATAAARSSGVAHAPCPVLLGAEFGEGLLEALGGFEQVLPRLSPAALSRWLEAILPGASVERLGRLAGALVSAAEGSAARVGELLGRLQRAGAFLWEGGEARLRPGPLPDLGSEQGLDPGEWGAVGELLLALEASGGRASIAPLAALLERDATEVLARAHDGVGRGWLAWERGGLVLQRTLELDAAQRGRLAGFDGRCAALAEPESTAALAARCLSKPADAAAVDDLNLRFQAQVERAQPERALDGIGELESRLAQRGRSLPRLLRLQQALAWAALGRPAQVEHALAAAGELDTQVERALAERIRGDLACLRHEDDRALVHFERAAGLDERQAPAVRLLAATSLYRRSRDQELIERFDAPAGRDEALSAVSSVAELDRWMLVAMAHFRAGDAPLAEDLLGRLDARADAFGDAGVRATLAINRGLVERRTGRLQRAAERLERAAELGREAGRPATEALALGTLGGVWRDLGELSRAEQCLARAQGLRERMGDASGAANLFGMRALCTLERGHAHGARLELERAIESLEGSLRHRSGPILLAKLRSLEARLLPTPVTPAPDEEAAARDPRLWIEQARTAACLGESREQVLEPLERGLDLIRRLGLELSLADGLLLRSAVLGEAPDDVQMPSEPWTSVDADRALLGALLRPGSSDALLGVADHLATSGRDDRVARAFIALAARSGDRERRAAWLASARAALARCSASLSPEEAQRFRDHLLGFPDPCPEELALFDAPATEPEVDARADWRELIAINRELVESEDMGQLLHRIVDAARRLTGAERAVLVLEREGELRLDEGLASSGPGVAAAPLELSRSVLREALESEHPLRLSNASDDPLLGQAPSVHQLELRSILAVGLRAAHDLRGVVLVDDRLRLDAFDERAERLLGVLADQAALALRQRQRLEQIEALAEELQGRVRDRERELVQARRRLASVQAEGEPGEILGGSPAIAEVRALIERLAPANISVLVRGDSGTGKELAARALHSRSPRAQRSFVAQNCAALPESLFESELFGHVKGAFTGADRDHPGLFERADGGTLFLDEIGEMPLALQAKLLRVLETSEVQRLGAERPVAIDLRLVCATNRDLRAEVGSGRFREDLFFRLAATEIRMPSLAERPEDIPLLAEHFLLLEHREGEVPPRIGRALLARLTRRAWPGNVRELRNEIRRLLVLSDGDLDDPELVSEPGPRAAGPRLARGPIRPLAELEREAIEAALEHSGDDKAEAARLLGISRAKIYQRLKEWRS